MGSRGRSIRLRIYFLVAIPLITMLGLFSYVAYTSVTNWLNLDRAPNLIQATSEPVTDFVNVLQTERRDAVVYMSKPGDAASLSSYQSSITATDKEQRVLEAALNSPGTKSSASAEETAAINTMTAQISSLTSLRNEVMAKKLAPLDALGAYTNVIAGQGAVLQAAANSIADAAPALQGVGLISAVNTQEDVSEQDAVLASALATGSLTAPDRVAFSNAVGRQQDDTMTYQELFTKSELTTYTDTVSKLAPKALQNDLATIQQAVPAGIPLSEMKQQGLTSASWQLLTGTWLKAASSAGTETASAVLAANSQPAVDAKRRVIVLAAVGAAGLILTLLVSLLLSRSINRRLTTLRRSALTLAQEQLPSVVARLRRGESVDVAAEAPALRVGNDEIGQVGQAIDTVRQTAIRSAIDEARVRQGVNDMFRNLARRNQSLLQRQLTVLDEMERRATDPDVLEDLFKMDHLTTRMRRHAEGLIILSGAPPGRSWSAPVKLIDVMRGAVAEVEDYARVTVSTQARAALAGSAVTDVIHLLAELIENATTLSPPFTQVRVAGETVANGFAIEIEDRGLGMVAQRLQELNERLANPPDINPANTEQLGLFVVGQLARRHGIRVMLRPSPYGGTTAVVLVPAALIVEGGPAAITSGNRVPAAADAGASGAPSVNGPYRGNGANWAQNGGHANGRPGGARPGAARPAGSGPASRPAPYRTGSPLSPVTGYPVPGPPDPRELAGTPNGYGAGNQGPGRSPISFSGRPPYPETADNDASIFRGADGYGAGGGPTAPPGAARNTPESGARRGRHGAEDVPVVTGVPVGRPTAEPAPEFDVFTPIRRPEQDDPADAAYPQSYPDFSGPAAGPYPAADPYPGAYGAAPGAVAYQEGSPAYQDSGPYGGNGTQRPDGTYPESGTPGGEAAFAGNGDGGEGYEGGDPADGDTGADDFNGLPRRVRQASLAPQLRASAAAAASSQGSAGVPPATAASLADMRNTLSAMQRGWQQGRSQTQRDTED
jgi:signal transduction histidine kinase